MASLKFKIAVATACAIFAAWSLLYAYKKGKAEGMSKVQAEWAMEKSAQLSAQLEIQAQAKIKERGLQQAINDLKKEKKREAARLATEYSAALASVHDRPEARAGAGGLPENPGAGVGCTGEGLARPDAEFLIRYAADAAGLQSALSQCVASYDRVRREMTDSAVR